jgi:hypothetical protein
MTSFMRRILTKWKYAMHMWQNEFGVGTGAGAGKTECVKEKD